MDGQCHWFPHANIQSMQDTLENLCRVSHILQVSFKSTNMCQGFSVFLFSFLKRAASPANGLKYLA